MTEDLIWIEISKKALGDNLKKIRRFASSKTIFAVAVKANAYGHGLAETAKIFAKSGANWLCVNSIKEAEILRKSEIKKPILIMGYVQNKDLSRVVNLDARIFLYDLGIAKALLKEATKAGVRVPVFIKVDTGLSRLGVLSENILSFVKKVKKMNGIKIEGIATHFATDDGEEGREHFRKQMAIFKEVANSLKKEGIDVLLVSGSSSATAVVFPEHGFDMIRIGIGAYGYCSSGYVEDFLKKRKIKLEPALSLKTKVAQVKEIEKGSCVSYGCEFVAKKKMKIAILPIGYYDGLDRTLGGKGSVLIKGKKALIIGRVCMNMIMVDVSGISGVKSEDEAVIIGKQGKNQITADEIARQADTINYEVLARLRESIVKKYV